MPSVWVRGAGVAGGEPKKIAGLLGGGRKSLRLRGDGTWWQAGLRLDGPGPQPFPGGARPGKQGAAAVLRLAQQVAVSARRSGFGRPRPPPLRLQMA